MTLSSCKTVLRHTTRKRRNSFYHRTLQTLELLMNGHHILQITAFGISCRIWCTKADNFRLQICRTSKRQSKTSGRRSPLRQLKNTLHNETRSSAIAERPCDPRVVEYFRQSLKAALIRRINMVTFANVGSVRLVNLKFVGLRVRKIPRI